MLPVKNLTLPFAPATSISGNGKNSSIGMRFGDFFSAHAQK